MFRSVNSIVIAPANTGSDNRRSTAVIITDHTNNGNRSIVIPGVRILIIVVMKLIAPRIDDTPARCREKMVKSTLGPECAMFDDSGGYRVHPVPDPISTNDLMISRVSDGGNSQNLMLFSRGNAISGAPIINGTSQFLKPPIIIGITMKKIIINACDVTIALYVWLFLKNGPGCASSIRISILNIIPIIPDHIPNKKYIVPISL